MAKTLKDRLAHAWNAFKGETRESSSYQPSTGMSYGYRPDRTRFHFTSELGVGNVDRVMDFVSQSDIIGLDDAIFGGMVLGRLSASAFVAGTKALDADDRIIYNAANGALYYDADGNGAGAAIYFANLGAGTTLIASDIVIF